MNQQQHTKKKNDDEGNEKEKKKNTELLFVNLFPPQVLSAQLLYARHYIFIIIIT